MSRPTCEYYERYQLKNYKNLCTNILPTENIIFYHCIRQVNGVKLVDILFLLLSVCVCVCAHSVQSSTVSVPPSSSKYSYIKKTVSN